ILGAQPLERVIRHPDDLLAPLDEPSRRLDALGHVPLLLARDRDIALRRRVPIGQRRLVGNAGLRHRLPRSGLLRVRLSRDERGARRNQHRRDLPQPLDQHHRSPPTFRIIRAVQTACRADSRCTRGMLLALTRYPRRREAIVRLGLIGLGRMGGNMTRRLRAASIEVVGFADDTHAVESLARECGMIPAASLEDVVDTLRPPRIVWLMLPAGEVTHDYVLALGERLEPGDIVVDGANSHYQDSIAHGAHLGERGIEFVDAGVSGGVWGLDEGYALMVGGPHDAIKAIEPALRALAPAPDRGWLHCGLTGSGHFVKMVHNGIEYGMMQAYAEGFALLESRRDFGFDLAAIAEMWRHGSVVRSWLLDLTAAVLRDDAKLEGVGPYVADSGEGRWTAIEAIERGIPAPVISTALMMRFASQGGLDFGSKLLAMMRKSFGGHAVRSEDLP